MLPTERWMVAGRAIPPALPEPFIPRPGIDDRLDAAVRRRLVLIEADAGFGKSTALAAWAITRAAAWYTLVADDRDPGTLAAGLVEALSVRVPSIQHAVGQPFATVRWPNVDADEVPRARAFAGVIADALARVVRRDLVLVLDDVQVIERGDAAARLLEALCLGGPPGLHIVLLSRTGPPFAVERLRGQGQVAAFESGAFAFDIDDVRTLLIELVDGAAERLAPPLHEATGGWPAAVRLAAEALRLVPDDERAETLQRALRPGGPVFSYLAEEAFDRQPESVRRLVARVAPLPRFNPDLCAALGLSDAGPVLADLAAHGRFVQPAGDGEWLVLHPLIREFALGHLSLGDEAASIQRAAAEWFAANGHPREAITCLRAVGDTEGIASVLARSGPMMLAAGDVDGVIEAASLLPDSERSATIEQLDGEARQVRGDWEGALACFRRLSGPKGPIPAGVAWRMGLIHHLRGELDAAVAVYRRGRIDGSEPADAAMLQAWRAAAHWLRGEIVACRREARRALTSARAAHDDRALAAAHTVHAMLAAFDSDRRANDAHYLRALDHATRAGDVLQVIRIRTNRGSRFVEEGDYATALEELDDALRLADLAGFASFRALALSNRGEALWRLGRLDEAIVDLDASRALYQRLESRLISYPLGHLGDVYRERGDRALARGFYEEAIAIAETAGDLQGLVPALGGLARIVADEDPTTAGRLVTRALDAGPVLGRSAALVAAAWVALARTGRAEARVLAGEAAELARTRRDRAGLAAALEVLAVADDSEAGQARTDLLDEAAAIWRDLHASLAEARTILLMAEIAPASNDPARSKQAAATLRAAGARWTGVGLSMGAAPRAAASEDPEPEIEVRTLGGFQVIRDRSPVPLAEWRSRKARDVLKLLIARRGGPVARDELADILWPDEPPDRLPARLSVLLSTARGVLDPGKRHPPDHYVVSGAAGVRLRTDRLSVDVEAFLDRSSTALRLIAAGPTSDARAGLETAETLYRGDFLQEDPYADWTAALREEARHVYLRVASALADLAAAEGGTDAAASYLLRILERDRYDESAHLRLCAILRRAGRHGEARRIYGDYLSRMEELGVEPSPFPAASA